MKTALLTLLALVLFVMAALTAAPEKQTITGIVTYSMCPTGDHSGMRMGPTDAECTIACVMIHGAEFVIYDGKSVYSLSDQKTPEMFAAKKVTVTGTLDAKTRTIQVESITAAK